MNDSASSPRSLRTDLVAHFAYALIAVAFFPRLFVGEVLSGGSNIYDQPPFASSAPKDFKDYSNEVGGDVWRQFATFQRYQHEVGKAERFPFWNPHTYLGTPFHANGQTALFHPWHVGYWVFDADSVRGPLAILRLWIGAAATYLLLRRWNLFAIAAFAGGAAWMFAQFNVRWLLWPPSNTSLWLPVLAWTLDRMLEKPSLHRLAHASLAAAVLQLSGHPETQFQAGVIAGFFVLVRLAAFEARRVWVRGVLLSLAAMILGTVASAVQTLPFLHQLARSVDWIEHSRGAGQYLPVEGMKMMLVPDCFGRPRAGHGYEGPSNYLECGCGFGEIALASAAAAFIAAILGWGLSEAFRRLTIGLGIASIFFGGLAFGMPMISGVVAKLPLFNQLNPGRWLLGMEFFGVLLAAFGVQAALNEPRTKRWLAISLLVVLLASGWIILQSERASPTKLNEVFAEPNWRVVEQHPALHALLGWTCTLIATAAVAFGGRSGIRVVAVMIALQGFVAGWDFAGTSPRIMIDPPEPSLLTNARALVGNGRIIGTEEVLSPNLGMRYGIRDARGYDFPLDYRLAKVFKQLGWGWNGMTFVPRKAIIPETSRETAAFLERCAVRAIFSNLRTPEITVGGLRWRQIAEGANADALFVSPKPAPRVRIASAAKAGTAEEAFAAVFQPMEKASVILEGVDSERLPRSATGTAKIVRDEPERIDIEVDSPTGGALVLADRMSPGWEAALDGDFTTSATADYLFRAVIVPPGKHQVVWNYAAPGFVAGVWISGILIGFLIVASIIRR
jgi:hypothetical protein